MTPNIKGLIFHLNMSVNLQWTWIFDQTESSKSNQSGHLNFDFNYHDSTPDTSVFKNLPREEGASKHFWFFDQETFANICIWALLGLKQRGSDGKLRSEFSDLQTQQLCDSEVGTFWSCFILFLCSPLRCRRLGDSTPENLIFEQHR